MRWKTLTAAAAATLMLAGCAGSASLPTSSVEGMGGEMTNVDRFVGRYKTPAKLVLDGKNAKIAFPNLQNNMGENFALTSCEASFSHTGTISDSDGTTVFVYKGSWPAANSNCALFVQRLSATFSDKAEERFLFLEPQKKGTLVKLAEDRRGDTVIAEGVLK